MNWLGKLVQKEISKKDTVLDLGCGIMACTLDTCPTYPKTRLKCRHITGMDVHSNYLHLLKERPYITVVKGLLPDGLSVFVDSSFDVVLLLDIIEHLEYEKSMLLISEAERIARRKVIIYTPAYFYDNQHGKKEHFPYTGMGDNSLFEHKIFIEPEILVDMGYNISFPKPDENTYGVKEIG